jgi:hypothetical protein
MLIRVLLGKYDLLHHVSTITAPADRTTEWICDDYVVRSWLYGSISDEILDIIMAEEQTAQEAWTLITNLFLDNQMTRAVYLEAEFHGFVQGDLFVMAYCHRLKAPSDGLHDVDTLVTDQTLVLNCLRGLNPCFAEITTIVTMQNPLPSFSQTRSLLVLRETQLANPAQVGNQVALYGAGSSSGANNNRGGDDRSDHSDHGRFGDGNGNRNNGGGGGYYRKKKNGGGGNNGGGNGGNRSGGNDRASETSRGGGAPPVGP